MRKSLLLSVFLFVNIFFFHAGAQVKGSDVLEAGKVGAVVKTAAVNENMDSAGKTVEEPPVTTNPKSSDADNELKKRYVFTGAGFLTIIIITLSVRRRRKAANNKLPE